MSGSRRIAVAALGLSVALLAGCADTPPEEAASGVDAKSPARPDRPTHLLLITVDTLRADRLGSYGHAQADTPAMDRLAAEGARITEARSHVPMTLPAHASLFTGRLPIHTGVRNNGTYVLEESEHTLAEILKDRGFHTGAAVSAFVLLEKFGLAQGFDAYDDRLGDGSMLRAFDTEIPADRVLEKWRRYLRADPPSGERPFFYWAHFYDPHLPYEPPEPYRSRFPDEPYDGEVAFVDRQIGEMLADLEERGLLESTLVVLTSDHGEGFGEHGEHGHGLTAYREALHVPLILRGPGVPAGLTVEARVGLVDVLPTILELFGGPGSGSEGSASLPLDGESFAERLRGEGGPSDRRLYFETLLGQEDRNWAPLTGLYSGDYKFISLPEPELYDLNRDPDETRNLVRDERRLYRRLDQELRDLLLGTADGSRRELTEEDTQKLQSLGYVSGGGGGEGAPLDPKDGLVLDQKLRRVEELLESGRTDDAEETLRTLRREFAGQTLPSFFLFEHRIAVARGRVDGAIDALERGITALPEVYPLRYELAKYLIDAERLDRAQEICRGLVERHPDLSQGWILLGRSLETSDPRGALAAYARARELEPDNLALAERVVDFRLRSGDLDGALDALDALVRDGAYDRKPEGLFKAAMLHMRRGTTHEAERLFELGLGLDPDGFYTLSYALVLDRNGKPDQARDALERALASGELTPQQAQMARAALARGQGTP